MSSTAVADGARGARAAPVHAASRAGATTLVALFEREFVEPQEAVGARVVATFRDLDDPDRFVWLRGFADMAARADALGAFYGGPAWQAHREAANATMVDSDNVLLLRPLGGDQGLQAALQPRPPVGRRAAAGGVFTITVCPLRRPADDALVHAFDQCVHPWWVGVGGDLLACWVTEPAAEQLPAPARARGRARHRLAHALRRRSRAAAPRRAAAGLGLPRAAPSGAPIFPARRRSCASRPPPVRRCVAVTHPKAEAP